MIRAALLLAASDPATPQVTTPWVAAAAMSCDVGPVDRHFGDTEWSVYACRDGKRLAIMAKPDSRAAPFCFVLTPSEDAYVVSTEGGGDRIAAEPAGDAIRALSAREVRTLMDDAWTVAAHGPGPAVPPGMVRGPAGSRAD